MTAQVNFAKGEVSPEIHARFDVAAYTSGVRQARNVRVMKYGGLAKRMGTRFVGEVADATKPVRLVPFQFSFEQAYALEMGHGYMRPAANGGMVLEADLAITGISSAAQAVVAAAYHGFAVGDQVFFTGGLGAMGDLLNGRAVWVVAVGDAGHFTIAVDTTGVAFTGWTGGATRTGAPAAAPAAPVVSTPTPTPTPPITGSASGNASDGGGTDYQPPARTGKQLSD